MTSTRGGRNLAARRPRVLHITEAPLGGVLGCMQEIICEQARSGAFEGVYALIPEVNLAPLRATVPPDVEVQAFRHRRGSALALVRLALGTLRMVREVQPDVVHVHATIAGAIVRICLAGSRGRPKILYCPHLWAFSRLRLGWARFVIIKLERLLSHATDRIICVSEYDKNEAIAAGVPASKCVVVPNGIDGAVGERSRSATDSRCGRLKILFIGRFDNQKGFDVYLEVMRRLADFADGVAVGSFIVNKDKPVEVPRNVTMFRWRSREELRETYEEADLLLMPSRSESAPLVALEAMRFGLPIFASRAGGLPEIVVDGVTGCLFDLNDIEGIVRLIRSTSHATLSNYGIRGEARFREQFTAAMMSQRLLVHYRHVLSSDDASGLLGSPVNA